jgi:branched-chain amino acid transport system ATP-binding protein
MLELSSVRTGYGAVPVLDDVTLEIAAGEILAVGGPNGAGKSTLLKLIAGLLPVQHGTVRFDGEDISANDVRARAASGIILCPEGRRIFSSLSIEENLLIGATPLRRRGDGSPSRIAEGLERAYTLFPILKERRATSGGALSGGQQQMLAIARALMARPRLLLLDEPSLGLSPLMADEIYATIATLRDEGLTLVVVEEAAGRPLAIAQRGILLRRGRIVRNGPAADLLAASDFAADYLGHAA